MKTLAALPLLTLLLAGMPQIHAAGSMLEVARAVHQDEVSRLNSVMLHALSEPIANGQAQVEIIGGTVRIALWQSTARSGHLMRKMDSLSAERALLALDGFESWRVRIVLHDSTAEAAENKESASPLLPEDLFQFLHHNFDSPAPEIEVSAVQDSVGRGEWAELWIEPPNVWTQPTVAGPLEVSQPVLP